MKVTFKREEEFTKLYLEAENMEEAIQLIENIQLIKKPVKAYGRIQSSKTWAWIMIPNKKTNHFYDLTAFDNEGKK